MKELGFLAWAVAKEARPWTEMEFGGNSEELVSSDVGLVSYRCLQDDLVSRGPKLRERPGLWTSIRES